MFLDDLNWVWVLVETFTRLLTITVVMKRIGRRGRIRGGEPGRGRGGREGERGKGKREREKRERGGRKGKGKTKGRSCDYVYQSDFTHLASTRPFTIRFLNGGLSNIALETTSSV